MVMVQYRNIEILVLNYLQRKCRKNIFATFKPKVARIKCHEYSKIKMLLEGKIRLKRDLFEQKLCNLLHNSEKIG